MVMLKEREITIIPIPNWVRLRPQPWKFGGWISYKPSISGLDFDELVQKSLRPDHGEIREVDYYEEGAVIWWKEMSETP